MSKITQPLKWHGGKFYLADWLQKNAPPHIHRVHVFGGGLAEFWNWPHDGISEVVNDVNGELTNFFESVRTCFPQMRDDLLITPFSERRFEYEKRNPYTPMCSPDWRAAVSFFIRYRQSRQGLGQDFATLSKNRTRRGMNEQVSSWLTAVDGLEECSERIKRVAILNSDFMTVIKREDGPNTFFYLDPPYWGDQRTSKGEYQQFEMSQEQHRQLLERLGAINGSFMISGYHSPLYDEHAERFNWKLAEKQIDNKAASGSTKPKRTECIWMNY